MCVGVCFQRWGSADFNGPDEALCHRMLDAAVLEGGLNLIDTAIFLKGILCDLQNDSAALQEKSKDDMKINHNSILSAITEYATELAQAPHDPNLSDEE